MSTARPAFAEVQRFRQPWLWALLAAVTLLGAVTVVGLAIVLPVLALVYAAKLETEVREDAVYVRFAPFHRTPRRIPFDGIAAHEAVEYRPIVDYGGWGIRWSPRDHSWAYTVSGRRGVRFERAGAAPLLVGSQRPEAFAAAIDRYRD